MKQRRFKEPGWQGKQRIRLIEDGRMMRLLVDDQLYMSWPSEDDLSPRFAITQLLARFSHTLKAKEGNGAICGRQGWLSDNEGSFGIQRARDKQDKVKSPISKEKDRIRVELRAELSPDIE